MSTKQQVLADAKKAIEEKMGSQFLDAIFEGTTQDTLVISFENSIVQIAAFIQATGGISVQQAADILTSENPNSEYRRSSFVGHACKPVGGELKFTKDNLVAFELKFFKVPSDFPYMRYGQAFVNVFGWNVPDLNNLYYEQDASYARDMVWLALDK